MLPTRRRAAARGSRAASARVAAARPCRRRIVAHRSSGRGCASSSSGGPQIHEMSQNTSSRSSGVRPQCTSSIVSRPAEQTTMRVRPFRAREIANRGGGQVARLVQPVTLPQVLESDGEDERDTASPHAAQSARMLGSSGPSPQCGGYARTAGAPRSTHAASARSQPGQSGRIAGRRGALPRAARARRTARRCRASDRDGTRTEGVRPTRRSALRARGRERARRDRDAERCRNGIRADDGVDVDHWPSSDGSARSGYAVTVRSKRTPAGKMRAALRQRTSASSSAR